MPLKSFFLRFLRCLAASVTAASAQFDFGVDKNGKLERQRNEKAGEKKRKGKDKDRRK
jgi:hypothetical protein